MKGLSNLLNPFRVDSERWIFGHPLFRNRVEFTADPERVKEFVRTPFTRSRMTRDILTRFHLSNHSMVVGDDDHAAFLRKIFRESRPSAAEFIGIARELMDEVLSMPPDADDLQIDLSTRLVRATYVSLLSHMLGIELTRPVIDYIRGANIQPGSRPLQMDGVLYVLGTVFPRWAPMREIIDILVYRGERRSRVISGEMERLIFQYAVPRGPNTWYAALLDLKATRRITSGQFRGELTSMMVSSYSLAAAMSSMLLCLAACPQYVEKVRHDPALARCFVNESLRLYPPFRQFGYEQQGIWDLSRRERAKLRSTDLFVTTCALHRNGTVWEEPDEFRPERFLSPDATRGKKFIPFGMGRRACSGRQYASQLLYRVLSYVCSEECDVTLALPDDFERDAHGLPISHTGCLVAFPVDDRVLLEKKAHTPLPLHNTQQEPERTPCTT